MKNTDKDLIIEQLKAKGALSAEVLLRIQASAQQKQVHLFDVIKEEGILEEELVDRTMSEVLRVPYIQLLDQEIPVDVLNVLSQDIAENYHVVPWKKEDGVVSVAMLDPHDYKTIEVLDFIGRRDQLQFRYYITSESSFKAVLRQYANLSKEVEQALEAQEGGGLLTEEDEESATIDIQSAPVSKMVAVILRYAVEGNASDVHIEPAEESTRVRYRVDGVLHTSLHIPKAIHNAIVARIKVLANLKLDETRLPQDGRFRMTVESRQVDFRVSTMPLVDQEKVVLRILDKQTGLRTLAELGYADRNLRIIQQNIKSPHGMVLMTGPTGSGKSSSLYSLLQLLNEESRNIITLEDPVEYNMEGISQTQMHPEIGLTFARGLRAVLRQDPDVIMVGEIRDAETAELAVHAALTGHLLLSTLHTNDAIGAIPRLIDMDIEPFLIASSLKLIVSQRLVRRICEHCRIDAVLPVDLERTVLEELETIPQASLAADVQISPPLRVFRGKGCQRCEETGYRGRLAICEVILMTSQLQEIVATNAIHESNVVNEELRRQGIVTLQQDGFIKALRGLTTIEEVLAVSQE